MAMKMSRGVKQILIQKAEVLISIQRSTLRKIPDSMDIYRICKNLAEQLPSRGRKQRCSKAEHELNNWKMLEEIYIDLGRSVIDTWEFLEDNQHHLPKKLRDQLFKTKE